MAVITRYVVVRDGTELDRVFSVKKDAEAYDKMLDAAEQLAAFIKKSDFKATLDDNTVDALSVFLAKNGPEVMRILKNIKPLTTPASAAKAARAGGEAPATEKKVVPESKSKGKGK